MISSALVGLSAAIAGTATAEPAPSAEDVYIARCAAGQKSEFCAALAKRLMRSPQSTRESETHSQAMPVTSKAATGPHSAGMSHEELRRRWGLYAELVGKTYYTHHGGTETMTQYFWLKPGQVLRSKSWGRGASAKYLPAGMTIDVTLDPTTGRLSGLQADGSLISGSDPKQMRTRTYFDADRSLVSVIEKFDNGEWKLFDKKSGFFRSVEYTPTLEASLRARDEERARPKGQGGSGLLGALAMATGAALAGGNSEMVMGMAMKGAELTTDNEMSRNVLAGQSDAMIASGFERQLTENRVIETTSTPPTARSAENYAIDAGSGSSARASTTALPAGVPSLASRANGSSIGGGGPAVVRRAPMRFYWTAGLTNLPEDNRNEKCVSNVVVEPDFDWSSPERDGRAQAIADRYKASFLNKCARLRPILGAHSAWAVFDMPNVAFSGNPADSKYRVTLP